MKNLQKNYITIILITIFSLTSCGSSSSIAESVVEIDYERIVKINIERVVEKSAINFDEEAIKELYKKYPKQNLEIDSSIFKFFGTRINNLDYEKIQSLYLNNNLAILDEMIENRRIYLISEVYDELNDLEFSEFSEFILQNPEKINLVNFFIENFIFLNKEEYTYNDLYNLNNVIINDSDFKTEFETELAIREESIFEDIKDLSFLDLNNYYQNNKGSLIVIDNFIRNFVIPNIEEYYYFELIEIIPLLSFSSTIEDIENVKDVKRIYILSYIQNELEYKYNDENNAYLVFKEELKESIDDYFYPAFENFCEEYFDIGSDLYRLYGTVADFFSDKDRVGKDFIEDWQKFIDIEKIQKNVTDRGQILEFYVQSTRIKTLEDFSLLIDTTFALDNDSSIKQFGNVSFNQGRNISKSLAARNALTELGSLVIEGGAGFFTGGASLIVTRGVTMVGSAAVTMENDDTAKEKFIDMYETSMDVIFQNNDILFNNEQNIFYNKLIKTLDENL